MKLKGFSHDIIQASNYKELQPTVSTTNLQTCGKVGLYVFSFLEKDLLRESLSNHLYIGVTIRQNAIEVALLPFGLPCFVKTTRQIEPVFLSIVYQLLTGLNNCSRL